jgi:phosphopantetheine--protein transferase-like protein
MTKDNLLEILATVSRKERAQIQDSTLLDSLLLGSLGRAKLEAALHFRYGIADRRISQVATVSQLYALLGLDGSPSAVSGTPALVTEAAFEAPALPGEVQLGVDLESIADLPTADDYWEEDFYKSTFRPGEIAYALLQPFPRQSFTAMWCAKEALRKAVPAFASVEWTRIEVAHDTTGKPSLRVDGKPLGGALSLSHTRDYAVAVVNAQYHGQPAQSPGATVESPAEEQRAPAPQRGARLIGAISLVSLFLSILALVVTVVPHK